MKSLKTTFLLLMIALFSVSAVRGNTVAEELIAINEQLIGLVNSSQAEFTEREKALRDRETALFKDLVKSEKDASDFLKRLSKDEGKLGERFLAHIRFQISHEGRDDLKSLLKKWEADSAAAAEVNARERTVSIYGCEVNLLDGEWRNAPDGRRFWISNEFPEIILSPAEYQRYFKVPVQE